MRRSDFKRSGSGARTVCKRFGRGYGVVVYLILLYRIGGQTTPPLSSFSFSKGRNTRK